MNTITALRWAVASWAFAGLIVVPAFVLLDPLKAWRWQPYNPVYDQMMVAIYFAVGLCALRAVRDPLRHSSFLWFVVVSSVTHGLVMLYHALAHPMYGGHLVGDVWILAGAAGLGVPLGLASRGQGDKV